MINIIQLFQFITHGAPVSHTHFLCENNRIEVQFNGLPFFRVWDHGGVEVDVGTNLPHQPIQTIIRRINYCLEKVEYFTDHRFGKVILRRGFAYFERAGRLQPFENNRLFRFLAIPDLPVTRNKQKIVRRHPKALPVARKSPELLTADRIRNQLLKI